MYCTSREGRGCCHVRCGSLIGKGCKIFKNLPLELLVFLTSIYSYLFFKRELHQSIPIY